MTKRKTTRRVTDEDKMIEILKAHRDLISTVITRLKRHGISCRRTYGNEPSGDILIVRQEDVPRVKKIIASWE